MSNSTTFTTLDEVWKSFISDAETTKVPLKVRVLLKLHINMSMLDQSNANFLYLEIHLKCDSPASVCLW
jgi:hypothetical protein